MRYDFVITLRRETAWSVRNSLTGFSLLFFSFISFLIAMMRSEPISVPLALAALLTSTSLIVYGIRAGRRQSTSFRYWLLAAAAGWAFMPWGKWLLLLFLLYAFWESRASIPLSFGFSAEAIVIDSPIKRRIAWKELHRVILKDGLLTLDFKNNRLIQRETDGGVSNEQEFNAFCDRLTAEPAAGKQ